MGKSENNNTTNITNAGVGIGAVLAALISWGETKSILWTIFHMILGWAYVIYSLIIDRINL